jgi:hypothetical protein
MTVYYSDYIPASAGAGIEGRSVIDLTSTSFADLFSQAANYNSATTYSKGVLVYDQDSIWVYVNITPSSGNPPPTLPTISNDYWELVGTATNNTFVWIAYANSVDGVTFTDFTTGESGTRTWIGIATNKTTAVESTNPEDYSWSRFVGSDGAPGAPATSAYLTKDSAQLFAYANGNVLNYNGATGEFKVFAGSTDISSSFALSTQDNPQGLTINYVGRIFTVSNGFDANEDTASVTIRATGSGDYIGITFDKVFSLSKIKGGYEIVSTLPTTDLFEGRVVFLTSDDKLYRYTGTAWTSAVPAVDITGTLAAAQLAAIEASKVTGQLSDAQIAAIAAAKVTGTIVGTQIANGSITTAKIAANSITSNEIAANTITAADIAANTITAGQIAAGSITSAQIAANTITSGQIAADTITAGNIAANAITASELATNAVTADKINAGAVTAAKISVTQLSAITATIGTLRTATIGERTEISDNVIKVFDSANVVRVKIGNLAL